MSRGVVVEAYAQLVGRGLPGRAPGRPDARPRRPPRRGAPAPPRAAPSERPPRFDFRPGGPDVSLFPRAAWLASLRRALRDAPDARFDYGDPRGAPELRRALARVSRPGARRGQRPGRAIVTSGMAQGMALFGRVLVAARRPRAVAVEDPSSGPGRAQLASAGLEPVAVRGRRRGPAGRRCSARRRRSMP